MDFGMLDLRLIHHPELPFFSGGYPLVPGKLFILAS